VTWTCEECGFDFESIGPEEAVVALRAFGKRYRAPLTRFLPNEDGDAVVRARPAPEVWSALEYAAHVRDVYEWYAARVERTLAEDRPVFDMLDPDAAAVAGQYNEQAPVVVADELAASAERLAALFEGVPDGGWDRFGIARGEERSVLSHARRAVHEGNHHLLDIGRGMRAVRSGGAP
jgi:hypothetical protein